ncbi:MAG: OadG family protein [Agathobacter sp.]|nr:OadG family protein [Agathobacter sp.]
MKKKIALFLSVLSVVMMLGACGTQDPTTVDYNGVSYNELYQESLQLGTALGKASEAEIQAQIGSLSGYGEETAILVDLCYKWLDAMEVSGAYVGVMENGFTVTKSGKTLTTDLMLEFEDRDVVFQLVYNYHNMELTGVTINPVYSFGEKMAKAGMNTLISISIVFAVLIVISLLISCFKIFPYLEAKKREKAAAAAKAVEADNSVVTQIEQREEQEQELADDTELVAVIAAAIAAYEGTSTDGFVVRSIRRR